MGFKDWLERTFGDPEPPRPSLPAPPGEPEILTSLARVDDLLAEASASPLVRSRVARIDRTIRSILPRLGTLGAGSADAYAVVATATDYLPESVAAYLRLPRDWADTRPIDGGRTALMVLVDQLELLASSMERMLDAAVRSDAQALIAQGRFLDAKFGRVSPDGGGAEVLPPEPSRSGNSLDL